MMTREQGGGGGRLTTVKDQQLAGIQNYKAIMMEKMNEHKEKLRAEEEEMRRKMLDEEFSSHHPALRSALDDENSGLEGVGSHDRGRRRRNKNHHMAFNSSNQDCATFPHTIKFTVLGDLQSVEDLSPLKRNQETGELEWIYSYLDLPSSSSKGVDNGGEEGFDRSREPASTWRNMYDPKGVMRPYMEKNSTSRVVQCDAECSSITNSFPFPVVVFIIGGRVTRAPEDVLWASRINEIMEAFHKHEMKINPENPRSISFVRSVPPNQTINTVGDVIYSVQDSEDLSGGGGRGGGNNSGGNVSEPSDNESDTRSPVAKQYYAKNWVGVTKETMRACVLVDSMKQATSPSSEGGLNQENAADRSMDMSWVRAGSPLSQFIFKHWYFLTGEAAESDQHERWEVPSYYPAYFSGGSSSAGHEKSFSAMELDKSKKMISIYPILRATVRKALAIVEDIIDNLPFEKLEEHQFFLARLDGDSFSEGGSVTGERIIKSYLEGPNGPAVPCAFTMDVPSYFEVMSVKKKRSSERRELPETSG